jgi:hypothetical protein
VTGEGLEAGRGDWVKVCRLTEVTGKGLDACEVNGQSAQAGRDDWVMV